MQIEFKRRSAIIWAGLLSVGLIVGTVRLHAHAPVPAGPCDDFVTGGGWIPVSGFNCNNKASFGFVGGVKNGEYWGTLNYNDHCGGQHIKGREVFGYCFSDPNGNPDIPCRRILYHGTVNGVPGFTIVVDVCDNGEPGREDIFVINVYTTTGLEHCDGGFGMLVYSAGSGTTLGGGEPGGGNIQLHRRCP